MIARHAARMLAEGRQAFRFDALTNHEHRILRLLAEGDNSASIARKLGIAPQALRNHLHHINRKLRTHSRLEAVTHAQQRGLID